MVPDHQFAPNGAKECRNRPENPINRKRTIFCFETTPPKNSERKKNSRKNPSEKKIFLKNAISEKISTSKKIWKNSQLRKKKINSKCFYFFSTPIFFFEFKFFWRYNFKANFDSELLFNVMFRRFAVLFRNSPRTWKFLIYTKCSHAALVFGTPMVRPTLLGAFTASLRHAHGSSDSPGRMEITARSVAVEGRSVHSNNS